MPIYSLKEDRPRIDPTVYIAPTATIIGRVTLAQGASIWFNCVARGDSDTIFVGAETNIQDFTMLHTDPGKRVTIGERVTIGHRCIIHGCTIADNCLIGMGAIIMNGAQIGRGCVIAAGSVILENTVIPPFSLVAGIPGKIKRTFEEDILASIDRSAQTYVDRTATYQAAGALNRIDGPQG